MDFSLAKQAHLPEIMALFRAATQRMDESGIPQWDELYPDQSVIAADIARQEMTIGRIDGQIAVAFMLEVCQDGAYEPANWRYLEPCFVVLHRLCVHPAFQGRGIAHETMDYLERETLSRGVYAIRLDAFSQNPAALRLYTSCGYEKAGEIQYRKGVFYLYEKKLSR